MDAFVQHQNLIRGAVSSLKERGFKTERKQLVHNARRAVISAYYSARRNLPVENSQEYLAWAGTVLKETAPEMSNTIIGFDNLVRYKEKISPVDLSIEVSWMVARANQHCKELDWFVAKALNVENLILQGSLREAIGALDAIDEKLGVSYWSLQLRVAIEHATGGLEAQKALISSLRKRFKSNMISFILYYTGVRNEERTTWEKFTQKVESFAPVLRRRPELIDYVKFRLLARWPDEKRKVARILAYEQGHGLIDLYETLISFLQNSVKTTAMQEVDAIVRAACGTLKVRDHRLLQLERNLCATSSSDDIPIRSTKLADALFDGSPLETIVQYRSLCKSEQIDVWQITYASIAASYINLRWPAGPKYHTLQVLTAALRQEKSLGRLSTLEKYAANFQPLPFAASLRDLLDAVRVLDEGIYLPLWWTGLNCRWRGIEDRPMEASNKSGAARAFWLLLQNGAVDADCVSTRATPLAAAVQLFRGGAASQAVDALQATTERGSAGVLSLLESKLLTLCHRQLGSDPQVINVIARAVANNANTMLLPIRETIADLSWRRLKSSVDNLDAAIALHALWVLDGEDEVATMLRLAFSVHLRKSTVSRPSELADMCDEHNRSNVVYYLKNVCVPNFMDMSPAFSSSREVIEERAAVCASLKQIDPLNSEQYDSEIYDITNRLVIADGIKLVDTSRIYVDIAALTRWAKNEVQEDYERYRDLSKVASASNRDFDELLREVFATIGARQVFFTPDSTSDALLTDIVARMRNEFLQNSDFGLDYFLSKRVRHQSFSGLLRGPLEFNGLITTRDTEFGAYKPNLAVADSLSETDQQTQEDTQHALAEFSEKFDTVVAEVKDEKLQVRDVDHPHGVFDITISSRSLFMMNSLAQTGLDFEDFLRVIYQSFWSGLDISLMQARKTVAEDLKTSLCDLFDALRAALRMIIVNDALFAPISSAIGQVSVEVQRNLDEVSAWFVKPESQGSAHHFTLKQCVEIAVQSALKSHRAFDPDIEIDVSGEFDLQAPDLLLLTDAIFIALDNVRIHCKAKKRSSVKVACWLDDVGYIRLQVKNEVSTQIDRKEVEFKLQRIRALIDAGNFGKIARKEGGSGFLKIAAALKHSAHGTLSFGFDSPESFGIELALRPTLYTVAVLAA